MLWRRMIYTTILNDDNVRQRKFLPTSHQTLVKELLYSLMHGIA